MMDPDTVIGSVVVIVILFGCSLIGNCAYNEEHTTVKFREMCMKMHCERGALLARDNVCACLEASPACARGALDYYNGTFSCLSAPQP